MLKGYCDIQEGKARLYCIVVFSFRLYPLFVHAEGNHSKTEQEQHIFLPPIYLGRLVIWHWKSASDRSVSPK